MPIEMPGFKSPENIVPTTLQELRVAGRQPENLESLKKKSLGVEDLGDHTWAMVLLKYVPYAPGPGLDNMVFVAKENGCVNSLGDLEPEQLQKLFGLAEKITEVYREVSDPHNPLVQETFALNFHATGVPEQAFDKKLHAQTLPDFHLHVVGFRANDLGPARVIPKSELSRQEWHDVHDPFTEFVSALSHNTLIQQQLLAGVSTLQIDPDSNLPGVNLVADSPALDEIAFSRDLIALHHNFLKLYHHIASLLVDENKHDTTGMPIVKALEERSHNIEMFINEHSKFFSDPNDASAVAFWLRAINPLIKSGEHLKAEPQSPDDKVIFLRGPAYTASMIRKTNAPLTVNLSPRILSTGNFLSTLGYHRSLKGGPTAEWLEGRSAVADKIQQRLADERDDRQVA